ncbi:MAG TPA: NADP-dependent phosphogluconate dehydrogenase [Gammaproteobacteria bacterium]|jgi:6-phosphogluconate dehydrogenase
MTASTHQLGIVGLGRIGGGLALQALKRNMQVIGYDLLGAGDALKAAGIQLVDKPEQFRLRLQAPRRIFVYVPAGEIIDRVLAQLTTVLEAGDVIVDGGNSYWGDSIRRFEKCRGEYGIHFVDCGTSGGARGARNGACFMVGGTKESFDLVEPILAKLAVNGGLIHCGTPGSGHFVKLVHNGIEFGMLQAIGEGLQLLEHHREPLPVANILQTWNHGSVIRSWLIELLEEQYREYGGPCGIPAHIEDTGEVNWLIEDAMHMEIPIPVIAQSVMQLLSSRDRSQISQRAVAMMRHGFGEHAYGPNESVARARHSSRVGAWLKPDSQS